MYSEVSVKVTTLLENQTELGELLQSDRFNQYDVQTQLRLVELNEQVDASLHSVDRQLDTLNCKLAEVWLICQQPDQSAVRNPGPA